MEYVDINDQAKLEALKKVKQIFEMMKTIRIKYYPSINFSEEDKNTYDRLNQQLSSIPEEYNLKETIKNTLNGINNRYESKDGYEAAIGCTEAEVYALRHGKIKQMIECQNQLKAILEKLPEYERKSVLEYKRSKFGELTLTLEQIQEEQKANMATLENMFENKDCTIMRGKSLSASKFIEGIVGQKSVAKEQEEILQ